MAQTSFHGAGREEPASPRRCRECKPNIKRWSIVENECRRCGGALRQGPILSNYKSYVVSLAVCEDCGETVQRTENAHRVGEQPARAGRAAAGSQRRPKVSRHTPAHLMPDPSKAPDDPPAPDAPSKPAKRIERPFNIRVSRRRG